ncbi:MAG: right-handed parallel beta-helix repeat-containing protein [Candidatus Saccharibacteria bacterium]
MTNRLPIPGADDGSWGNILNDFLDVEHNSDGSLKIRTDGTVAPLSAGKVPLTNLGSGTVSSNQVLTASSPTTAAWASVPSDSSKVDNSISTAKGDILVGTASSIVGRLGIGSNHQSLKVDSSTATGLKWEDAPAINVKDYGALGDSITNDTTAVTTAIAALTTAGTGTLFFPSGTYLVDGLIVSGLSDFCLSGTGSSILKLSSARTGAALVNTNDVLAVVGCSDFQISGLEIHGNRHSDVAWPTADHAPVTQYLTANAVSGQATVTVQNGAKFIVGERVWVCGGLTANGGTEHDQHDNNNQQGIAIDSINGNILTLHINLTNTYTGTGSAGGAYVTTYQTAYQNTLGIYTLGNEDQQNGIHLLGCSRFVISDCFVHDTWESPIKLGVGFDSNANDLASSCSHGLITRNRCLRGYDQGISIWGSRLIQVAGNYISDTGWAGCSLTGSDDCVCTGNIVTGNYYRIPGDNSSGYGCVIEGGARNIISNNTISANYGAGVLLRVAPTSFGVSGTTLSGNLSWGSTSMTVASGAGFVVGAIYMINNGSKSESFKVASVASNIITLVEKTRYYHPSGVAVGIRAAEDNTVEANMVSASVNSYGMWISPAIRSNIRHNTIERNYSKGVLIEQSNNYVSGGTIVDGNYFSGNNQGSGGQALLVDSVNDVQILNNRVAGNYGDKGIHLKGSTNSKIIGNSVSDVQSDGIALENGGSAQCARIIIANNDVKQCDGSGIYIQRGSHLTIQGNELWANAGSGGMALGGLTHSTVKGNVAVANATNGILLLDNNGVACTYNFIEGNVVRDDGSGIKASDGSGLTQTVSIKEQDNANHNNLLNNQVDVTELKVGANTTISGELLG